MKTGFTPTEHTHSTGTQYRLHRDGNRWHLLFAGQAASFKHELGALYVFSLLCDPPRLPLHAVALALKARGRAGQGGPALDPQEVAMELGQAEAVRGLWRRQRELEGVLANRLEIEPVKAEALEELEQVTEALRKSPWLSHHGAERCVRAVGSAIKSFHGRLSKAVDERGLPDKVLQGFAAHLLRHLLVPSGQAAGRFGRWVASAPAGCFTYEPPRGVRWEGSPKECGMRNADCGTDQMRNAECGMRNEGAEGGRNAECGTDQMRNADCGMRNEGAEGMRDGECGTGQMRNAECGVRSGERGSVAGHEPGATHPTAVGDDVRSLTAGRPAARPETPHVVSHKCGVLLALVLGLAATGCTGTRALRGGQAVTTRNASGASQETFLQGENPAQASRQEHSSTRVRTYTLPAGSRVAGGGEEIRNPNSEDRRKAEAQSPKASARGGSQPSPINSQPFFTLSAPMPVTEREETQSRTDFGAAQKDMARELGAKLSSLRGIVWIGAGLFVFGLASLVWPPLRAVIASVTTSAALVAGGLALMVLPTLVVGHELLLLGAVGAVVGGWFLAHRHGQLSSLKAKV